jgi:hypothetical protein
VTIAMTAAILTAALEATAAKNNPKDTSPFRTGDNVVYPTHGVGHVKRVSFEEIAGHRLNFIHISFDDNQMTSPVPVAQAGTAGLRKLASRKSLAAALATLKGRPRVSRLCGPSARKNIWRRSTRGIQAHWPKWFAIYRRPGMVPAAASANALYSNLRSSDSPVKSLPPIESRNRTRSG